MGVGGDDWLLHNMPSIGFAAARNPDRVFSVMTLRFLLLEHCEFTTRRFHTDRSGPRRTAARRTPVRSASRPRSRRARRIQRQAGASLCRLRRDQDARVGDGRGGHGIMQATIGRELFLHEFAEIAREIRRPITYTALLAGMYGPVDMADCWRRRRNCATRDSACPLVTCRPLNFEFHRRGDRQRTVIRRENKTRCCRRFFAGQVTASRSRQRVARVLGRGSRLAAEAYPGIAQT